MSLLESLGSESGLDAAIGAVEQDLLHEHGPRISTMRNYRFAILQYRPEEELRLRREVRRLTDRLRESGWRVLPIDLQKLLLDRIRKAGDDWAQRVVSMEKKMSAIDRQRGLGYLHSKLTPIIEGPDGLAADCVRRIHEEVEAHPEHAESTLAIIGRAGGVHPFFRSSALLRHLDGRTRGVPVLLLYPGERRGPTGLSFMGILEPDNDYRPRIYS